MNRRYFISILLVLSLGALLLHGEAFGFVKLRASIYNDPLSLDPPTLSGSPERQVTLQIYQGLVGFDYNSEPPYPIVPVLAESYKVSEDGKMITFKLRKGVKFHHNYGELTAEDVSFSMQRHFDPKIASKVKGQLSDVDRIETPDQYTVQVYLKIPSALSLIESLAWPDAGSVVSKKACAELGDKIGKMPVGTGPFYFDRWEPGEKVVLKKFGNYWRTPARIDEIEFWVIPEETTALAALEKGDLDLVSFANPGPYEMAKKIKGVYIAEAKGSGCGLQILYINHIMKPMNDLRVRQAIAHALDIKGICSRIGPVITPWPSPLAKTAFAATDEFWPYKYDLDKAKKLLAEAGYPNGFELQMIYNKSRLYEAVALETKNCLSKILDVKLKMIERAVYYKTVAGCKDFHIAVWGNAKMSPLLFAKEYESGDDWNLLHYVNPKVDEAIVKAKTARTEEERRKDYREFQRIESEDLGNYCIGVDKSLAAIRNNVKGVIVVPYTDLSILEKAYID